MAAAFYASNEYYVGIGGGTDPSWVTDLYAKLLDRPADPGGLAYWTRQTATAGRDSVARRFFQSPESARARLTGLYQDLLGRAPDPSGLAYWSAKVVTAGDLALAVNLAASNEYRNRAAAASPDDLRVDPAHHDPDPHEVAVGAGVRRRGSGGPWAGGAAEADGDLELHEGLLEVGEEPLQARDPAAAAR